ncbi:MAG TPA: hypothetical protein VGF69_09455 [Thermoanaerobaculia bacterium]|jgi:hypothetical protein
MQKLALCLLSVGTLLLGGCFEIEHAIDLKKDLSGDAGVKIGIDFEPMITVMAQMQREMSGKTGPATKEELAKAKADFKKNAKKTKSEQPSREEIEKELPEGIKLIDANVKETDFGMKSDFRFTFDTLAHLVALKLPSKEKDPTKKNVVDSPFAGLQVVEKGKTITIRTKPSNPADAVKKEAAEAGPKADPETEKLMKDAFSKLKVAYRISAPFEIVSHNATRREGNTLIWEYDLAAFEKLEKEKKLDDAGVKVVYRR